MGANHALKTTAHGKLVWTAQMDAELRRLWAEGAPGSEIAATLRVASRNAALARARRLGLQPRKAGSKPRLRVVEGSGQRREARVALPPPEAAQRPDFGGPEPLPASARPWTTRKLGECAWPIETGQGVWSCCAPVREGRNYCKAHCRRMYAPTAKAAAAS